MEPMGLEVQVTNPSIKINVDGGMNGVQEAVNIWKDADENIGIWFNELQGIQTLLSQSLSSGQSGQILEAQADGIKMEIMRYANLLLGNSRHIRTLTASLMDNWSLLKMDLDNKLKSFVRQQRLYANGRRMDMTVEMKGLQELAVYLMQVVWDLRGHLETGNNIFLKYPNTIAMEMMRNPTSSLLDLITQITSLIKNLVQDTFIVIHQPCQVIRTNTQFHLPDGTFPTEVSLLVGSVLGLQLSVPPVFIKMINKEAYLDVQNNGLGADIFQYDTKWRLTLRERQMGFYATENVSKAAFPQLCLTNFTRHQRNNDKLVVEEFFYLLFQCELHVNNESFKIWTTSLPLVVTTHSSQDSLAWGFLTWHNEFYEEGTLPDRASWWDIREMLNYKFSSITGAPLTATNLEHFANILSNKFPTFPDSLSWTDLCKTKLLGVGHDKHKFTFCQWFFETAGLVKEHLQEAWINGSVVGFIDKGECERFLRSSSGCAPGTFQVRFSDSTCGAISIVWLHSDGEAYSRDPFKIKSLENIFLAEQLNQDELCLVYPNVPKEIAFKKHFDKYNKAKTKCSGTKRGYVQIANKQTVIDPCIPKFVLQQAVLDQRYNYAEGEIHQKEEQM